MVMLADSGSGSPIYSPKAKRSHSDLMINWLTGLRSPTVILMPMDCYSAKSTDLLKSTPTVKRMPKAKPTDLHSAKLKDCYSATQTGSRWTIRLLMD